MYRIESIYVVFICQIGPCRNDSIMDRTLKGCLKKNSKIWDIGPKGGRGSGLNPNFFDILIGTNTLGGRGSESLCHKKMQ